MLPTADAEQAAAGPAATTTTKGASPQSSSRAPAVAILACLALSGIFSVIGLDNPLAQILYEVSGVTGVAVRDPAGSITSPPPPLSPGGSGLGSTWEAEFDRLTKEHLAKDEPQPTATAEAEEGGASYGADAVAEEAEEARGESEGDTAGDNDEKAEAYGDEATEEEDRASPSPAPPSPLSAGDFPDLEAPALERYLDTALGSPEAADSETWDVGRCGAAHGGATCSCIGNYKHCNEVHGWCGATDVHKAGSSGTYDCTGSMVTQSQYKLLTLLKLASEKGLTVAQLRKDAQKQARKDREQKEEQEQKKQEQEGATDLPGLEAGWWCPGVPPLLEQAAGDAPGPWSGSAQISKYAGRAAKGQCNAGNGVWGGDYSDSYWCLMEWAGREHYAVGDRVLDWGSGCGHKASWMRIHFGVDVYGLDLGAGAVEWANSHSLGHISARRTARSWSS